MIQAKEYAYHGYACRHQCDELENGKLDSIEERLGRLREMVEFFEKAVDALPKVYDQDLAEAKQMQERMDKDNNLIVSWLVKIRFNFWKFCLEF